MKERFDAQCPRCGRAMSHFKNKQTLCTNPQCPTIKWRPTGEEDTNIVELIPAIERDSQTHEREFVGTLYVKEIRVIQGCRCQGVSLSTVAVGEDKKDVKVKTFAAAETRAQMYRMRGYEVTLKKPLAA